MSVETRISQGKKAIALAREKGMDTSLWEKELVRLEALAQAEEVARRTKELLDTRGWCKWQCEALGNEAIMVANDFAEPEDLPQGYPIYTETELGYLYRHDTSEATLRLVHEAKRIAGAKIITGDLPVVSV